MSRQEVMTMTGTDTERLTIAEAGEALRTGRISSVELTQTALERIARDQPRINAFITVTEDVALEQAARADAELRAGQDRGPLMGIPVAVKDLFDTSGIRTTCASGLYADRVPEHDADVVIRLRNAGAVLTGKLNMDEFAFGPNQETFGRTNNPFDLTRTAGGSSGGAGAAVATDAIFAGVGTDTGGSIRMPAAFCGLVGLKPTWGRISLRGGSPVAWTMDHAGPLTRTVADARAMLDVLTGRPGPPPAELTAPPRLAVVQGCRPRATTEVIEAFDAGLQRIEAAGATICEERVVDGIEDHLPAAMLTIIGEASLAFEDILRTTPEGLAPMIRAKLELGVDLRAADYLRAQRYRSMLRESVESALDGLDALISPTMLRTAWTWRELDEFEEFVVFGYTAPFSLTGNPALSLPLPVTGLPIGLQLIGHRGQDERLLDVARWLETALG
jgi:aspartyl-tRNA(Asn)/glutamyl-tRNA(Gln) amidotransferase subunit A